ncbi:MAG: hypothetical protein GY696_39825 [Gammaproteobacteria bacterium]|nr:hypothetical protein [Gammaproteobacteria bacterium]
MDVGETVDMLPEEASSEGGRYILPSRDPSVRYISHPRTNKTIPNYLS